MLTFHPVNIDRELDRSHPLYVGHFFPVLKGMWWSKRRQRQGLIISVAIAWYRIMRENPTAPGFVERETLITNLTRQVKDAKVILERFFVVKKVGYNFNDGATKSPSIITPRRLGKKMFKAVEEILGEAKFEPSPPPKDHSKFTKSDVVVHAANEDKILSELRRTNREDLIPPVTWLLRQPSPITFYFTPAGSLMARDKSVWPIRSIELWPGWLRRELFGTVVDIENAYVQFIIQHLEKKYEHNPRRLQLKYPDLLRADRNKKEFRNELCQEILKLPPEKENIDVVKRLMMSLANGSNATPALMTNGSGRSEAVRIVHEACPHLSPTDLAKIGSRLSAITKQFSEARRDLCIYLLNEKPSRKNQKKIFKKYFSWEREARYKIWEASGKTGLHLHDGIDGVNTNLQPEELAKKILDTHGIKVSVDPVKQAQ